MIPPTRPEPYYSELELIVKPEPVRRGTPPRGCCGCIVSGIGLMVAAFLIGLLVCVAVLVTTPDREPRPRSHQGSALGEAPRPSVEDRRLPGAAEAHPSAAPTLPIEAVTYQGIASQANRSHGPDYLAMREARGTRVTICGMGGCWKNARVTDYGPSKAVYPERVADIAVDHWIVVCGLDEGLGVCPVTVTILSRPRVPLPATDTGE